MKPLVAIETSGRPGSVALLLPDGTVKERGLSSLNEGVSGGGPPQPAHARTLVPEIAALTDEAGLARTDIGAVAVSVGPGSYTGLRVGVTAAKTLAWALSCDLVAVSTLEALASEVLAHGAAAAPPDGTRRLVPAVDARRGQVYSAVFELGTDGPVRIREDEVLAPEALARRLEPGDHVFGTASAAYRGALVIPEGATSAPGPAVPSAAAVARLGAGMLARGETVEPHALAPKYLREWTSPSV